MTDFHARRAGWDQGTGNAQFLFLAQQVLGVGKLKGQTQYGGDWG